MVSANEMGKLVDTIDGMRKEIIETIQGVVRIPSIVGNEADAQDHMEKLYMLTVISG